MDKENSSAPGREKELGSEVVTPDSTPVPPKKGLNKKTLLLATGALVVVVAIGGGVLAYLQTQYAKSKTASQKNFKIGVLTLLSGDYVFNGQDRLKAIKLAQKDMDLQNVTISIDAKDSQCDDTKAVEALKQLTAQNDVVAVIGEECSSSMLAAAPYAEQAKVVLISATATAPSISSAGDYIFRTVPSDAQQGKVAVDLIANKGYKKVAVLHDETAYGTGLDTAFSEALKAKGLSLVDDQLFNFNDVNVTSQLQHITAAKPDALYIIASGSTPGTAIMLAIQKLGLHAALFASETLKADSFIKDAGAVANGLVVTAVTDGTAKYKEHFRAEYGADPSDYSAQTYDAYTALALAIKNGATTGTQIKDYLYKVSFEGASGPVQFDNNGDIKSNNYDALVVQNGQFVPFK